jgi:hypothetical protein
LEFSFCQSFALFRLPSCPAVAFPNLTHLYLTVPTLSENFDWVDALPKWLRSLKILTPKILSKYDSTMSFETLNRIANSAELEELHLSGCEFGSPSDPFLQHLSFPNSLNRLLLCRVKTFKILYRLPKYAEFVSLPFLTSDTRDNNELIPISVLPLSLTEFSISPQGDGVDFILDAPLPQGMKRFSAGIAWGRRTGAFPPSPHTSYLSAVLPVGVELVHSQPPDSLVREALSLKQFHLASLFVRGWSPDLTSEHLSLMAPSITRLTMRISSEEQFQVLPTSLRALSLEKAKIGFSKCNWARLSNLEELHVDTRGIGETEVFAHLPRLSTLKLNIAGPCHLSGGKGALAYVSTTLKHLFIQAFEEETQELWTDWLLDLPRLTNLSQLSISSNSPFGIPSPPHYLTLLPKSLKSLKTILDYRYVSDTASLRHLPPHLIRLFLDGQGAEHEEELTLSNDHFASLPRGLSTLSLHDISGITLDLLPLLGDEITSLDLGSLDVSIRYYLTEKRAAKWQGLHPCLPQKKESLN